MLVRAMAVVAAVALVLTAACGDGDDGTTGTTQTTATTPPTDTTDTTEPVSGVDFGANTTADLGDGWELSPCEAGPPLFCFRLDGVTQGVVEPLQADAESHYIVGPVLERGGSVDEALQALATEVQESSADDRARGCGEDYEVEPFGPEPATVAGHRGAIYGFDGTTGGEHVERQLQFAAIHQGTLTIIPVEAIDEASCVHDEELAALSVEQLRELQPTLEAVIAASELP